MAQQPMYPALANSPGTEISTALTSAAVIISVLDATKLPAAPNLLTIGTDDDPETVLYTGKSGNNLTGCTRGFNGTTAQSWIVGSKVARYFTAYDHDTFRKNILDVAGEVETARTGVGPDYIGYDSLSERLEAERGEIASQIDVANAQLADNKQYVNYKSVQKGSMTTSQAIQELVDKGIETIYIPYGDTILTEPIVVYTGLEIIGFHNLNGKNMDTPMSTVIVDGFDAFVNPSGTRARVNFKNLKIVGTRKTEVGIGSNIGGYFENVWFSNLGKGFYSTESYGARFINCFFEYCDTGAELSQAYSVAFRDCTFNGNRIDLNTLDDCISFSVTNCLFNIGFYADTSIILKGDVNFDTNYIEKFGASIIDVVIDYSFDKFGNYALSMTNNSCGGGSKVNHVLRISLKTGQTGGVLSGEIAYNDFYNISSDDVIFGTYNDFTGPNIHDNTGLTVANRHPRRALKPITSSKVAVGIDVDSNFNVNIPVNSEVIYDNVDAFSSNVGKYTVRKAGLYRVSANVIVSSDSLDCNSLKLSILINDVERASSITGLKFITNPTHATISIDYLTYVLAAGATIHLAGSTQLSTPSSILTTGGLFSVEYIGTGE